MADSPSVAQAQAAADQAEADAQRADAKAKAAEAAVVAAEGSVTLVVAAPWWMHSFVSNVEGWGPVTVDGTAGPAASAAQVIAAAKAAGIDVEER